VLNKIFNETQKGGIKFFVYLTPGAKNEEITAIINTEDRKFVVKVSVQTRPINNEANKSLIEFIASSFRTPKTNVIIEHGSKSRLKQIFIHDYSISDIPSEISCVLNDLVNKTFA
jgi:uncharacterized protein (TIGR00251 family)